MRIGLISDPHANVYGLTAVLTRLRDCPVIVCAGDLTGYFSFVNETLVLLRDHRVLCVRGNHDEFLLKGTLPANLHLQQSVAFTRRVVSRSNYHFLESLPGRLTVAWDDVKMLICHGSPWDSLHEYVYPDRASFDEFLNVEADIIVLGHTHRPMVKHIGDKLIVNPGSCGQPRDGSCDAAYGIVDTCTRQVDIQRARFDMTAACEAAIGAGMPPPFSKALGVPPSETLCYA